MAEKINFQNNVLSPELASIIIGHFNGQFSSEEVLHQFSEANGDLLSCLRQMHSLSEKRKALSPELVILIQQNFNVNVDQVSKAWSDSDGDLLSCLSSLKSKSNNSQSQPEQFPRPRL